MSGLIERAATLVITVATAAVAATYVAKEVRVREARALRTSIRPDTAVVISEDATVGGIRIGPASAPVVLVEFNDFECPFCARYAQEVIAPLLANAEVAIVVQHYPLPNHRFAIPAAIASECADRQGAFAEMYHALFRNRELLGIKEWRDIANDAGVVDLEAFEACRRLPVDSFARIGSGQALGKRIGVRGTPAVVLNGKLLPKAPKLTDITF